MLLIVVEAAIALMPLIIAWFAPPMVTPLVVSQLAVRIAREDVEFHVVAIG